MKPNEVIQTVNTDTVYYNCRWSFEDIGILFVSTRRMSMHGDPVFVEADSSARSERLGTLEPLVHDHITLGMVETEHSGTLHHKRELNNEVRRQSLFV